MRPVKTINLTLVTEGVWAVTIKRPDMTAGEIYYHPIQYVDPHMALEEALQIVDTAKPN